MNWAENSDCNFNWQFHLTSRIIYNLHHDNTCFFVCVKTRTQVISVVNAYLISAFVCTTQLINSIYFLNPTFQASMCLFWLNSPICVGLAFLETPKKFFIVARLILCTHRITPNSRKHYYVQSCSGKRHASFWYSHLPYSNASVILEALNDLKVVHFRSVIFGIL